jgi:CrcB protein
MNLLIIALGGAIGSISRYLSFELITKNFLTLAKFPLATFFVNVFGSLLAGILYYFIIKNFDYFNPHLKNFLLVGFLGGFTTFSAFSLDFFRLFTAGQTLQAFIYAISSVVLAILALFFGFYLSKLIFS